MPKKRKPARKPSATLRVVSVPHETIEADLRRMGSLLVVQGAEVDLGQHMLCDHPIIIGRDERVDFSLNDGSISWAHCSVERADDDTGYVLIDLDSTNGTTLNGTEVKGRIGLETGDKIFLGSSVLRFAFSDQVDVQYHSKVEEMVQTDALTGLDSKRQYDAVFEVVAKQAAHEKTRLTVAVVDLDGLKAINDTHGHEMGSFTIAEVANLAKQCMENYGHLARFGGDEFVCCFPGIEHDVAIELAEELRTAVERHGFERDGVQVHPTICIGMATSPDHESDPYALFKAADDALYRAKRSGKNRVESAAAAGASQADS
ncbi:MAG: GGDEF domain-containing protein [Myxococcales bacterium]|nr:GGDEF domain-containing protein [Myxococcales bacterium]